MNLLSKKNLNVDNKHLKRSYYRRSRYLNEALALLDAIYLHCNDLSLNERLCNWYGELSLRLEEELKRNL